jgi:hypothetical protein
MSSAGLCPGSQRFGRLISADFDPNPIMRELMAAIHAVVARFLALASKDAELMAEIRLLAESILAWADAEELQAASQAPTRPCERLPLAASKVAEIPSLLTRTADLSIEGTAHDENDAPNSRFPPTGCRRLMTIFKASRRAVG